MVNNNQVYMDFVVVRDLINKGLVAQEYSSTSFV